MKWEIDERGVQSCHRGSGRRAPRFPLRSLWGLGLCAQAPWFRVSRCLLKRWKNACLPGGRSESKGASGLAPDGLSARSFSGGLVLAVAWTLIFVHAWLQRKLENRLRLFVCFLAVTVGKARARRPATGPWPVRATEPSSPSLFPCAFSQSSRWSCETC